jgi:CubicO group peptidase (beta-lactamase class C family)
MFCAAAMQSLYDAGTLKPADRAFAKLGISNPRHVTDHDSITIQQLLDHYSGYDDGVSPYFDPTYNMGQIANSLGVIHPTRLDICRYMYTQPLQHTPGATYACSNFGYLMLAALVDKYGGTGDYVTFLKNKLLVPALITEVEVISTAAACRDGSEAIAEDYGIGQNVLNPAVSDLVPSVYGGDGGINEVGVGNDGLGASAHAPAQFAHRHAAWGNGPRVDSGPARTPSSCRTGRRRPPSNSSRSKSTRRSPDGRSRRGARGMAGRIQGLSGLPSDGLLAKAGCGRARRPE